MFDTLLIITLFLLASLLVCLLTLRLSISIKHLSLFWFITDINGYFEIPTPPPPILPVYCDPPCLLNLTKISPPPPPPPPPFIMTSLFIRHLRVLSFNSESSNYVLIKVFLNLWLTKQSIMMKHFLAMLLLMFF